MKDVYGPIIALGRTNCAKNDQWEIKAKTLLPNILKQDYAVSTLSLQNTWFPKYYNHSSTHHQS